MRPAVIVVLALSACSSPVPSERDSAGARLEAAALETGMVETDATAPLVGSWGRDTDRVCMVYGDRDRLIIGARIDYGDGQGCAASGTAVRKRAGLHVTFSDCAFDAAVDGDRLSFPAELPTACDRLCTGRASLAALSVNRLSSSRSEAATLTGPGDRSLCAG